MDKVLGKSYLSPAKERLKVAARGSKSCPFRVQDADKETQEIALTASKRQETASQVRRRTCLISFLISAVASAFAEIN